MIEMIQMYKRNVDFASISPGNKCHSLEQLGYFLSSIFSENRFSADFVRSLRKSNNCEVNRNTM